MTVLAETLEQRAERSDVFYVAISRELKDSLEDWSQPVQIKLSPDSNGNPLVRAFAVRPAPCDVEAR